MHRVSSWSHHALALLVGSACSSGGGADACPAIQRFDSVTINLGPRTELDEAGTASILVCVGDLCHEATLTEEGCAYAFPDGEDPDLLFFCENTSSGLTLKASAFDARLDAPSYDVSLEGFDASGDSIWSAKGTVSPSVTYPDGNRCGSVRAGQLSLEPAFEAS